MIIAEEFSKWALSLKTSQITDKSKEVLKFLVKDICGIIVSARNENYVQSLVKTYSGSGDIISLGHGKKFDQFSSAIIAGTAAHGEDFDDTFEGNPMHIGASMIPALLSAGKNII